IASLFSMRYLLRILDAKPTLAWLGAILYAFAPYHFEVLYTRSGLSEHLAFVWVPFVFAGLFQVLRSGRDRGAGFGLLSMAWGLLLFSHVPTAVTIGLGMISVCLFYILKR